MVNKTSYKVQTQFEGRSARWLTIDNVFAECMKYERE
jgi:hypothetical protein